MKKVMVVMMAGLLMAGSFSATAVAREKGGVMGFIAGCCFGVRAGGAYNDGKEIHWREWCRLIPIANLVFAIWDGVDGTNGVTTADYAKQYGTAFF